MYEQPSCSAHRFHLRSTQPCLNERERRATKGRQKQTTKARGGANVLSFSLGVESMGMNEELYVILDTSVDKDLKCQCYWNDQIV